MSLGKLIFLARVIMICLLVLLRWQQSNAQYQGGNSSGFSIDAAAAQQTGLADSLYNGGLSDGISVDTALARNISLTDSLYNGGNDDGTAVNLSLSQHMGLADSLYNGGLSDGISADTALARSIGLTDSLYNGGLGQGFSSVLTIFRTIGIVDSLYNGGDGKGDILFLAPTTNLGTCSGDTLIWNGSVNIVWGNPANWDCGVVPGINSIVILPSGRPRYPSLFVNAEIRALRLQPGASMNVITGAQLKLNGQ